MKLEILKKNGSFPLWSIVVMTFSGLLLSRWVFVKNASNCILERHFASLVTGDHGLKTCNYQGPNRPYEVQLHHSPAVGSFNATLEYEGHNTTKAVLMFSRIS